MENAQKQREFPAQKQRELPTMAQIRAKILDLKRSSEGILDFTQKINIGIDKDLEIFQRINECPVDKTLDRVPQLNLRGDMLDAIEQIYKAQLATLTELEVLKMKLFDCHPQCSNTTSGSLKLQELKY